MTRVFTAETLAELHFVLGLLENAGIEAQTQNEGASWNWFELPFAERPAIVVLDETLVQRAADIVEDYMRRRTEGDATE